MCPENPSTAAIFTLYNEFIFQPDFSVEDQNVQIVKEFLTSEVLEDIINAIATKDIASRSLLLEHFV